MDYPAIYTHVYARPQAALCPQSPQMVTCHLPDPDPHRSWLVPTTSPSQGSSSNLWRSDPSTPHLMPTAGMREQWQRHTRGHWAEGAGLDSSQPALYRPTQLPRTQTGPGCGESSLQAGPLPARGHPGHLRLVPWWPEDLQREFSLTGLRISQGQKFSAQFHMQRLAGRTQVKARSPGHLLSARNWHPAATSAHSPERRPNEFPFSRGGQVSRDGFQPTHTAGSWQRPIQAGRLSPLHREASPILAHPGNKHSQPASIKEISSLPPPAAPPASRPGPGLVEPEFLVGFMPQLVTKEASVSFSGRPQEATKPCWVQGLGAAEQRVPLAVPGHSA